MFIARFVARYDRIFSEGQACFRTVRITEEQIAKAGLAKV